jgi:mRNA interferase MazF
VTSEPGDVVVVPFPFTDRRGGKRRPALVVSSASFNQAGHTMLAMITTKSEPGWPGDTPLQDHAAAGLSRPCLVRLKLFTLDNRLLQRRLGRITQRDGRRFRASLGAALG